MADLDLNKLAKLLEMLGSDQDGEVLSAAKMAHKAMRASKKTWKDVLQPPLEKVSPHKQERDLRGGKEEWKKRAADAEKEFNRQREHSMFHGVYRTMVENVMMRAFYIDDDDRAFIVSMNRKVSFDDAERRRINKIYNRAFNVKRTNA